jgi:hypothetical protein
MQGSSVLDKELDEEKPATSSSKIAGAIHPLH